jgi:predicted ATP-dependent endonuclease of OLD family
LNDAASRFFSGSLQLSFDIQSGNNQEISIQLIDNQHHFSPMSRRGTGIQTLLSLLASLLEIDIIDHQILLLIDEPETSLHADAQHFLRRYLEEIARNDNIQIIYATHSPAMINNMRPRSMRLLKREVRDNHVITTIDNCPIDPGYVSIRTSLGISPCDSLQFAPVMIVVEGATDVLGVTTLLKLLHNSEVQGFEDVNEAIPLCGVVDGGGDGYAYMARFCIKQKTDVVLFLDGDKQVSQSYKDEFKALNVALVQPQNNQEIEQLVDQQIYFKALDRVLKEDGINPSTPVEPSQFDSWLNTKKDEKYKRMSFSWKLTHWLKEIAPMFTYSKPRVFRLAASLTENADQVQVEPFRELMARIIERLPAKA